MRGGDRRQSLAVTAMTAFAAQPQTRRDHDESVWIAPC
jgi:hypothetical protein